MESVKGGVQFPFADGLSDPEYRLREFSVEFSLLQLPSVFLEASIRGLGASNTPIWQKVHFACPLADFESFLFGQEVAILEECRCSFIQETWYDTCSLGWMRANRWIKLLKTWNVCDSFSLMKEYPEFATEPDTEVLLFALEPEKEQSGSISSPTSLELSPGLKVSSMATREHLTGVISFATKRIEIIIQVSPEVVLRIDESEFPDSTYASMSLVSSDATGISSFVEHVTHKPEFSRSKVVEWLFRSRHFRRPEDWPSLDPKVVSSPTPGMGGERLLQLFNEAVLFRLDFDDREGLNKSGILIEKMDYSLVEELEDEGEQVVLDRVEERRRRWFSWMKN